MQEEVGMEIFDKIQLKIKKEINQTSPENREDLEQELKIYALNEIYGGRFNDSYGFFEYLDMKLNESA
ncbi:hypothetical protein [Pontibacillus yanchengensis]|uniref:Uncharacterized protein n=1 Tax=Pontibacillus yanchengensis Y32 TaxID=1385514 RepID=A0A0A2TAD2_9BACI|nr:hypothetical protein [Pontibacillus yanchengensis]KGP71046.1 hypothetical protein N782_01685 [Pontibacillus yanchengensis Y32]